MTGTESMVMTVAEVASFLRLAESTVYRLAQEGELPGYKIGGRWRFSREQVEALVGILPVGEIGRAARQDKARGKE